MHEGRRLMRDYKKFFPEIYAKVVGTEADPSEDNSRIPLFWKTVTPMFHHER
jgi:hypothetical protein